MCIQQYSFPETYSKACSANILSKKFYIFQSKSLQKSSKVFNTRTKYDVHPILSIQPDCQLDIVEEHKILGQIVRSDMKTISNTEAICKKAYSRMWVIRRLKALGCPEAELISVVQQQILSVCEVGVAWWGPSISKHESNMLERTFKAALHVVFQDKYVSFKSALRRANMKSLKFRRSILISRFAKKALGNEKHANWFLENDAQPAQEVELRRKKPQVPLLKPVTCRTQRYQRSSLPLMTHLLNWHPPLAWTNLDIN